MQTARKAYYYVVIVYLLHFIDELMNFNLHTSQGYKSPGNLKLTAFSLKLEGTNYVYTRTKLYYKFQTNLASY